MTSRVLSSPTSLHLLLWLLLPVAIIAQAPGQTPASAGPDRPAPAPQAVAPQGQVPPLSDREMLEKRADTLMARKDYRQAVAYYEKALALDPKNPVLYNKAGIGYHQQLLLDRAKKYYERAIKLNRKYSEAINNLGTVHYSKKKHKTAIKLYKQALELAPKSASIYSNLGTAYLDRKEYDEALVAYAKALELDPEVFEHRSTYGILLQERSVEDRARFHFFMAKIYAAAGTLDRALEYLRKALEEGFKDRDKIPSDPAFAELIKTEGYAQLMANPPTPLPQ